MNTKTAPVISAALSVGRRLMQYSRRAGKLWSRQWVTAGGRGANE